MGKQLTIQLKERDGLSLQALINEGYPSIDFYLNDEYAADLYIAKDENGNPELRIFAPQLVEANEETKKLREQHPQLTMMGADTKTHSNVPKYYRIPLFPFPDEKAKKFFAHRHTAKDLVDFDFRKKE